MEIGSPRKIGTGPKGLGSKSAYVISARSTNKYSTTIDLKCFD